MKYILILTFSFSVINFFASTAERLQKVKERILIVELPVKDQDYVETLKKKGNTNELALYENALLNLRTAIKTAFSKFWTLNETIEFVESDSLVGHINNFDHLYAIMRYGERGRLRLDDKFETRKFSISGVTNFVLYLSDESNEVLFMTNPVRQSAAGFIFSISQFNFCIDVMFKHPEINATSVQAYTTSRGDKSKYETKNLTLLINKSDVDTENPDPDKLAKVYPYKIKIVESEEIEKAMINQDPAYSCLFSMVAVAGQTDYTDKNHDGNRNNDFHETKAFTIPFFVVCVAKDGHVEAGAGPNKLEKMLIEIKKGLDKSEAKDKK